MRKRSNYKPKPVMLPRGLRPKLTGAQVTDLALAHIENLDTIAKGAATADTLWQWVGGVLTWSRVAEMLKAGELEMTAQLDLVASIVERYGRTGRIVFTGSEYQLAKDGVGYMDDLAAIVDKPTAILAAEWSEAAVNKWEQSAKPRKVLEVVAA